MTADREERGAGWLTPRPATWTGGRRRLLRRGFWVGERVGGGGGVEAKSGFGSVAEADRAELLGVLVHPGAGETKLARELLGVDELRPGGRGVWLAQKLSDALGDRFDGLRRELLDGGTEAAPAARERCRPDWPARSRDAWGLMVVRVFMLFSWEKSGPRPDLGEIQRRGWRKSRPPGAPGRSGSGAGGLDFRRARS